MSSFEIGPINEDDTNPDAIPVATIASAIAIDSDDEYLGLIVISSDQSNGVWQYRHSDSDPSAWSLFPSNTVLPLYNESFVRFIPNPDYFGSSYFQARGWDMTNNGADVIADFEAPQLLDPYSSPYSVENSTITLVIRPVNDPPVIVVGAQRIVYLENADPVQIFPDLNVIDIDGTSITFASVVLECSACNGAISNDLEEEVFSGMIFSPGLSNDQILTQHAPLTLFGNILPIDETRIELQITSLFDSSISLFVEYIRAIHFVNTDREPSSGSRTVTVIVNDGETDSEPVSITLDIELVNDEVPVVDLASDTLSYIEDSGFVQLFPQPPTITDFDDNSMFRMQNATVELIGMNSNFERLSVDCNSEPDIRCTYENSVLTIIGNASVATYEQILDDVMYTNTESEPINSPRTAVVIVNDGRYSSMPVVLNIETVLINDQLPILDPEDSEISFQEVNPQSPKVRLAPNMTVTDPDSGMFPFHSVVVELTDSREDSGEGLVLPFGYIPPPYVMVTSDPDMLTLSLTPNPFDPSTNRIPTGIPHSVVQTFIRNVHYSNPSHQPSGLNRSVTFTVFDDIVNAGPTPSLPATILVIFEFVDDLPEVELNNPVVVYVEGQDQRRVLLAPNALAIDVDNNDLTGLEITFVANRENIDISQESIFVTLPEGGPVVESPSTVDNPHIISLTGEANIRTYTMILRSLSYEHSVVMGDPDPGNRLVTATPISAAGPGVSDQLIIAFNVTNNAPTLDLNGQLPGQDNEVTFIEQGPPVLLTTPDLILLDVDNELLAYVNITLSPYPDYNDESLYVDASISNVQVEQISPFVITLLGPALAENFTAVLQTLQYRNNADEPTPAQRNITVTVSDGDLMTEARTIVNIQFVNDQPQLLLAGPDPGNGVEFTEEGGPVLLSPTPTVIDPDSNLIELRIEPLNMFPGDQIQSLIDLQFQPNLGYYLGSFDGITPASMEAVIASVTFVNNEPEPLSGERYYCFTVIDSEQLASLPDCVNVTFRFVNDNAPEFSEEIYEASIAENKADLFVITVSASDADMVNTPTPLVYDIVSGDDCMLSASGLGSSGSGLADISSLIDPLPCRFRIDSVNGNLFTTETPPDREMNDLYTLIVSVTDGEFTSYSNVVIRITDVNDNEPLFDPASYTATIPLGALADFTIVELNAVDPDIGDVTFIALTKEPPTNGVFAIDGATGRVYLAVDADQLNPEVSQYTLTFQALDNGFLVSSNEAVVIVDVVHNIPPMFEQPVYNVSVMENFPVGNNILMVTAIDPDENTVSYSVDDNRFVINAETGAINFLTSPDFESITNYEFQVFALDIRDGVAMATVLVTIEDQNEFPPMFVQTLYTAFICETTPLSTPIIKVVATDDDAGSTGIVSYRISDQSECEDCLSINRTTGVISLAAALDYETQTSFTVQVQPVDGGDLVGEKATVEILVLNENEHAPMFAFDTAKVTIPENYPIGNPLPLILRYSPLAMDNDNCDVDQCGMNDEIQPCSTADGLSYAIVSGNQDDVFNIDTISGAIFLVRNLDFDKGGDDVFTLVLSVSDGEFNSSANLSVVIADFNDNLPVFGEDMYEANVTETAPIGSIVITVNASDNDPTSQILYTLSGPYAEDFAIDNKTGVVRVASELDFERIPMYTLWVTANDGQETVSNDSNTVAVQLVIRVIDVTDELPDLLPPFEFFVNEGLPPGIVGVVLASNPNSDPFSVLLYSIESESNLFVIDEYSGAISTNTTFDYEEQQLYIVTVTVQVNSTLTLQDSQDYVVNVLDINDNTPIPEQSKYNVSVSEAASISYEVVQIVATDADSAENGQFSYSIVSGNDVNHFIIDVSTGALTVNQELDREDIDSYILTIRISDNGNPILSENVSVCISILDEDDNAPSFPLRLYHAIIYENTTVGQPLFPFPLVATDADLGSNAVINYLLQPPPFLDENPIAIDPISGEVTVLIPEILDREQFAEIAIQVTAYNPLRLESNNGSREVLIILLDLNDNSPVFDQDVFIQEINEDFTPVDSSEQIAFSGIGLGSGLGRLVFTISANDDDIPDTPNSQFEFTLLTHTDVFAIDPQSGEIFAVLPLDREVVDFYQLEILAFDFGEPPNSNTAFVNISVQDINDNQPQFAQPLFSMQLTEDVNIGTEVLQVNASDFDIGSNSALSFEIIDDVPFEIDSISGQITTSASLDRELIASYIFQVRVSDNGLPSLSNTADIVLELIDVNDNPPVISPSFVNITLEENFPPGPLNVTFSVSDADIGVNDKSEITLTGQSSSFDINGDGVLQVTGLLDFEATPTLTFSVMVRNIESPFFTAMARVKVQLINLNDNPPIVNFGQQNVQYLEGTRQLRLDVGAFINDADGVDKTILVDGLVELVGLDPREPSYPFISTTNESPIDCPLEVNKRNKFGACEIPVENDHFFTDPGQDDIIIFTGENPSKQSTISSSFVDTGMTISTWLWVEPVASTMTIISKSSALRRLYSVYCTSDFALGFQYTDSSNVEQNVFFENGCAMLQNAWHHLAVVVDSTQNSVNVYIDAALIGSRAIINAQDATGNVYLGARPSGSVNTARQDFLNGRIHLITISNTVATRTYINCLIGCGSVLIPSENTSPLDFSYDFNSRTLLIEGRHSLSVYAEFLNTLVLVLPLIEPVSSSFSISYTVQDDLFNCLPNFLNIILQPTNDFQPEITLNGESSNYNGIFFEEGGPVPAVNRTSLSLTDQDLVAFPYIVTVAIENPQPANSEEVLAVSNVPEGMNVTYENYMLTLSGILSLPMYESVLRTITYNNHDDEPLGANRQLRFALIDMPFNEVTAYSSIDIVLVNDLPVLTIAQGNEEYREGDGMVSIVNSAEITDSDNATIVSAIITLTPQDEGFESISVNTENTQISAESDSPTVVRLTNEDTLANYSSVLQSLSYEHSSDGATTGGTRRITISIFDGINSSVPIDALVFFLAVNDPPVIDLNGLAAGVDYETVFVEGSGPINITNQATLIDVDNATLAIVSITLTSTPDGDEEQLILTTPTGDILSGHELSYMQPGGSSTAVLQGIIRSVQYINSAGEPTEGNRTIQFLVFDGKDFSNFVSAFVSVQTANDIPFLDIDTVNPDPGYQTVFIEEGDPVYVTSRNVSITDTDAHAVITNVLVVIENAYNMLNERIESGDVNVNITQSTVNQTRIFTITPIDGSHAAVSQLLTTLVYSNTVSEPIQGTRLISISVSDGIVYSNVEIVSVDILLINEHSPMFLQANYSAPVFEELSIGTEILTVSAQDLDGGIDGEISYQIIASESIQGMARFEVDNFGVIRTTAVLDREEIDSYSLSLRAFDGATPPREDFSTVTVTILDVNDQAPQFAPDTLFSLSVLESRSAGYVIYTINAMDGDLGDNAMVSFELVGESLLFSVMPNGVIVVRGGLDADVSNPVYTLTIRASDNGQIPLSMDGVFTITVVDGNDNDPMFVPSSNYAGDILENTPTQAILTVTALDVDSELNGEITYSFIYPSNYFSVNNITGEISNLVPLDREERDTYILNVLATDRGLPQRSANATVTITVLDMNDNPAVFSRPEYNGEVLENAVTGTPILTVEATDADIRENGEFTFSLVPMANPLFSVNQFVIDPLSGVLSVNEPVDFELQPTVHLIVRAIDGGVVPLTSMATIVLSVLDENDNSPIFSQSLYEAEVLENEAGVVVATIFADDADSNENGVVIYSLVNWQDVFEINAQTGEITILVGVDFEATCLYRVVVLARDGGVPSLNATALVDVLVLPVNDIAPMFLQSSYPRSISENLPAGTTVAQVSATDGDETVCSEADVSPADIPLFSGFGPEFGSGLEEQAMLTYTLLSHTDVFAVNSETGAIVTLVLLDREQRAQYSLTIQVADEGQLTSTAIVTVSVLDVNDNPPEFLEESYTAIVAENAEVNTEIVQVQARDRDFLDQGRLVYDLLEPSQFFAINNRTGTIFVSGVLDFESLVGTTFRIIAIVRDSDAQQAIANVDITVRDQNDLPPSIDTAPLTFNFTEGQFNLLPFPEIAISDSDTSQQLCNANVVLSTPENLNSASQTCMCTNRSSCISGCVEFLQLSAGIFPGNVTQSDNGNTLTLEGLLSISSYISAIMQIQYINIISNPEPIARTLSLSVFDCQLPSNNLVQTINIQPLNVIPPVIDLNGPEEDGLNIAIIFTEGGGPVPIVSANITITDNDVLSSQQQLTGLTVVLTNPIDGDSESISYNPSFASRRVSRAVTSEANISLTVVSQHSLSFAGESSLSSYSQIVRSISYVNQLPEPTPVSRMIEIQAQQNRLSSEVVIATIEFAVFNNHPPVIRTFPPYENSALRNLEGTTSALTAPNAFIDDLDSTSDPILELQVFILSPGQFDRIFLDNVTVISTAISMDRSSQSSIIFSGNASAGEYTTILRGLRYQYNSEEFEQTYPPHFVFMQIMDSRFSSFSVVQVDFEPLNDEQPMFTEELYVGEVPENATVGYSILQVSAVDGDRFSPPNIQYSILAGNEDGHFRISETDGVIYLNRMVDFEAMPAYTLTVQAEDLNYESDQSFVLDDTTVDIMVVDVNEHVPMFTMMYFNASVAEGVPIGTSVLQVMATDLDSEIHSELEFTLFNTTDFLIDSETGIISTAAEINILVRDEYEFYVRVRNPGMNPFDFARVTITVLDLDNNRPVITLDSPSVVLSEPETFIILSPGLLINDPDLEPSLDFALVQLNSSTTPGVLLATITVEGIMVSGNETERLTFTGERQSLSDYASVLRGVVYVDTADEPLDVTRTVIYQVGSNPPNNLVDFQRPPNNMTSEIVSVLINVELVNDNVPMLALDSRNPGETIPTNLACEGLDGSYSVDYSEDGEPVVLSHSSLGIIDSDSGDNNMFSAFIEIENEQDGVSERLLLTLPSGDTYTGHRLILPGPYSIPQLETMLRNVR